MSIRRFALPMLLGLLGLRPLRAPLAGDSESPRAQSESPTEVTVVAALHGLHKQHPNYDYGVLYDLVARIQPDLVGVEIRPEDIGAELDYLKRNYPAEMIELARRHADRAFGVDWLGTEIAGRPIPPDYWQTAQVMRLSKASKEDADFQARKPAELAELSQRQSQILAAATPATLVDGRYAASVRRIDALEAQWYRGSPYTYVLDFNRRRDAEIALRLIDTVGRNPGKRIVVVLGADHVSFAKQALREAFGDRVRLSPPAE
jgi:hypothetical protein